MKFDTMGETEQEIMRMGFLLAMRLQQSKIELDYETKEARDYFVTSSFTTENPPPGFTKKQWEVVEKKALKFSGDPCPHHDTPDDKCMVCGKNSNLLFSFRLVKTCSEECCEKAKAAYSLG